MKKQSSISFKQSDFKDFQYAVVFLNSTMRNGGAFDSSAVRVAEFTERGLIMRVAGNLCAQGHILTLYFFPEKKQVRLSVPPKHKELADAIEVTAKVIHMEHDKEASENIVTVEFYQLPGIQWKKFKEIFGALQGKVDYIMKVVKE